MEAPYQVFFLLNAVHELLPKLHAALRDEYQASMEALSANAAQRPETGHEGELDSAREERPEGKFNVDELRDHVDHQGRDSEDERIAKIAAAAATAVPLRTCPARPCPGP